MTPQELAYQEANKNVDIAGQLWGSHITMAVLVTIAVALRLYCRRITKVNLWVDDYLILVAAVCPEPLLGAANLVRTACSLVSRSCSCTPARPP